MICGGNWTGQGKRITRRDIKRFWRQNEQPSGRKFETAVRIVHSVILFFARVRRLSRESASCSSVDRRKLFGAKNAKRDGHEFTHVRVTRQNTFLWT